MKKVIFIFFVICIVGWYKVYSFNDRDISVSEEILPIRDNNGDFKGLDCFITIPDNYDKEIVELSPDIFGAMNEYSEFKNGNFLVNIKIINNSLFDYKYLDNSFFVETTELEEKYNYLNTGAVGFDSKDIYDVFIPYRVKNRALIDLLSLDGNFSDDNINLFLNRRGYSNLTNYYLDYYNSKYSLNCDEIRDCSDLVTSDIFTGEETEYLESDIEIIGLAYDNFYNNILSVEVDNKTFSVGEFMKNKSYISNFNSINIGIKADYSINAYKKYHFIGRFGFSLRKL